MSSAASSPAATPSSRRGGSSEILTPSRKIKALLARFDDSASESDDQHAGSNVQAAQVVHTKPASGSATLGQENDLENTASDDDDIALPTAPRGRLAARMQAKPIDDDQSNLNVDNEGDAYSRVRDGIRKGDIGSSMPEERVDKGGNSTEEDELAQPGPKRRLLLKRKRTRLQSQDESDQHSRSHSPLFFPSPSRPQYGSSQKHNDADSEAEHLRDTAAPAKNNRFLELVQKHRKIRLQQEAADIVKRAARVEKLKKLDDKARLQRGSSPADGTDEDSDLSNNGANTKLSKQSRPTRKASKKALEEMNRETQRISRNMQLAHQAKTKKKITKDSFLARFNFSAPGAARSNIDHDQNKSATASSVPTSDFEGAKMDTPPTSPMASPHAEKDVSELVLEAPDIVETAQLAFEQPRDLSSVKDVSMQPVQTDKGKDKVVDNGDRQEQHNFSKAKSYKATQLIRVRWSKEDAVIARAGDSDSDLEIVTSKSNARKVAVFERLPQRKAKETYSHLMLRSLAHINEGSKTDRASMNTAEMEAQLRRAARLQAKKERAEKIEELKAKGVVIQTAEERQLDQQEVEDLVERARQEAAEIQKREKEIAKKDGTFVKDGLDDDDSGDEEDGDFEDEGELEAENVSGSEEEDRVNASGDEGDIEETEGDDEEEGEEGEEVIANDYGNLIDEEVDEQATDEESAEAETEEGPSDEEDNLEQPNMSRKLRQIRVLSDDDEPPAEGDNMLPQAPTVQTPQSVLRSARKAIPGLQMSDDLPMGLTQAFAATMADSQMQAVGEESQVQDSFQMTRDLPSPDVAAVPQLTRLESIDIVSDSQAASQTQPLDVDLSFSQPQAVPQSPLAYTPTQASQMPFELTQDVGYVMSPFAESRFDTPLHARAPQSTVETVIVPRHDDGSPILQRKGRLRRGEAPAASDDEKEATAFDVMRRAAARKAEEVPFDKSKSNAKEVIDEAAEESEDEYAGLGGASDDDAGEEDEDDRKMIDHDEDIGRGDEGRLAGLFA
jgi:mediator of replication checkpoint protein 1